jgi:DNA end-binding protein Ku
MKGHKVVAKEAERPSGGNVVDLMEALKRSVGEGAGSGKGKSARSGKKRA